MAKRRWVFFFGFERSDDSEVEADEVATSAIGYTYEPDEAAGEGWSQDHGDDEDEARVIGFRRS